MPTPLPPKSLLRSIALADAQPLVELIRHAGAGLATLPQTVKQVEALVEESEAGDRPTFVLERTDTGEVIGLSSIIAALPDAAHTVTCEVRHEDNTTKLRPHEQFVGATELCTLFLTPEMRGGGNGRLLSLGRFLEIANRPALFADTLIVELRGVLDEEGVSPLWRAVCDRIFQIDHVTAHRRLREDPGYLASLLSADGWLDLSPISPALRELLGRVHQNTEPARRLLAAEGFVETNDIDLLDAGPVLACEKKDARLVRESMVIEVTAVVDTDAPRDMLISTTAGGFRCCRGAIGPAGRLAEPAARALRVEPGVAVRCAPLRPVSD